MLFCIIEGADNSGKSTLASYLSAELGVPLKHSGGPGVDKTEFFNRIETLLDYKGPVIFDRFPIISEYIYAPIVRGKDTFEGRNTSYRIRLFGRRAIIIYCRPPLPIVLNLQNHQVKPEHETSEHVAGVVRNQLKIVQRYDQVMSEEYPDALYYDYTAGGYQFRQLLVQFLRYRM